MSSGRDTSKVARENSVSFIQARLNLFSLALTSWMYDLQCKRKKLIIVSEMDKYTRIRNPVKMLDIFSKTSIAIIIIIYYLSHMAVKNKTATYLPLISCI